MEDTTTKHRQKLDEVSLFKYLVENSLAGADETVVVKSFNHGQSNPTYFLELEKSKRRYVLRRAPPGKIVSPTAHRVDREFRIMKALGERKLVPVPHVHVLCENHAILGSSFYIMEFCDGRVFKAPSLPEIDGKQRKTLWFSAIDTLASLHDVDVDKVGLADYGPRTADYFKRQVKTLSKVSAAQFAVDTIKVPKLANLEKNGQFISENILVSFDEPRPCIVHGDYKMDNLLVHPKAPQVIAVIDWEMSTLGTFGADLANLLLPFYVPSSSPLGFAIGAIDKDPFLPTIDELLERYCEKRVNPSLDPRVLKKRIWLYLAFQSFKFGVILQGIASRSAKGQASNAQAEVVGSLAPEFDSLTSFMLEKYFELNRGSNL